jgi:hypothetical protein
MITIHNIGKLVGMKGNTFTVVSTYVHDDYYTIDLMMNGVTALTVITIYRRMNVKMVSFNAAIHNDLGGVVFKKDEYSIKNLSTPDGMIKVLEHLLV